METQTIQYCIKLAISLSLVAAAVYSVGSFTRIMAQSESIPAVSETHNISPDSLNSIAWIAID